MDFSFSWGQDEEGDQLCAEMGRMGMVMVLLGPQGLGEGNGPRAPAAARNASCLVGFNFFVLTSAHNE